MNYNFSYQDSSSRFVQIEFKAENIVTETLSIHLPAWRPGRYELGNFAKNVRRWQAFGENGELLKSSKTESHTWQVETAGNSTVVVRYEYYCAQLDAGACWLDDKQLYINPVHCCLYIKDRMHETCVLTLQIPETYQVAIGLPEAKWSEPASRTFVAADFHELVDSPFIASEGLKHQQYYVDGTQFHIWFMGECKPDWEIIIPEFEAFTVVQKDMFGTFPFTEYHFIYQILPHKAYHGVEHQNSTVIALGPSYDLMKPIMYPDFMGVSSHELFHAWNIKAIRPAEMMPYDYSKENYSRLGYVAEGITTYYGDLILFRSKDYSESQYFKEIVKLMQKHFHNYGRFNLSVAEASFDTWVDGYVNGIPHRKTSIYTEGAMFALMLDLIIRRQTGNEKSLDDVMRALYHDFASKGAGYTEKDYFSIAESVAGMDLKWFFDDYYYGTRETEPLFTELLSYVGLAIHKTRSRMYFENRFGFKIDYSPAGSAVINTIAPGSLGEKAKLSVDDEIISINGIKLKSNLKEWCKYFQEETIELEVNSQGFIKKIKLVPGEERYFMLYSLVKKEGKVKDFAENFKAWTHRKY